LFGCTGSGPEAGSEEGQSGDDRTGISILAAVESDVKSDIASVQYRIDRVACAEGENIEALSREIRADLLPAGLPGGIPGFDNAPLDGISQHQFADHFEVLPAGCYDVGATPLKSDASASADCGVAQRKDIQVADGNTTEVFLLSQCAGPEVGAVDTVVAFNQPPQIVDLTFSPSKFVAAGAKSTVCARARDLNGDQLEYEWNQVGGSSTTPAAVSTETAPDASANCIGITPAAAGNYQFEVRINDLLRDENNNLVRFERWLADNGSPNASSDSLRFSVYAGTAAGGTEPNPEPNPGPERQAEKTP